MALALLLPMAACAPHAYAPGPGLSAADFGPDSARCRLFARGTAPGYAFGAVGSPRFVAAATVGAALGSAIGTAVHENAAFNDCMQERGWLVADGTDPNSTGPMGARLAPGYAAPTSIAAPTSLAAPGAVTPATPSASVAPRRNLGLQVLPVTAPLAAASQLPQPGGLFVVDVLADSAAATGGLRQSDVVLAFNQRPLTSVDDLQLALARVTHGDTVMLTVWRDGHQQQASLTF